MGGRLFRTEEGLERSVRSLGCVYYFDFGGVTSMFDWMCKNYQILEFAGCR